MSVLYSSMTSAAILAQGICGENFDPTHPPCDSSRSFAVGVSRFARLTHRAFPPESTAAGNERNASTRDSLTVSTTGHLSI